MVETAAADELRSLLQRLFRRFGLVAGNVTPCGKPLSLAHAHALMVLALHEELSQQVLARELCIDKSNVARLCARMSEDGHVQQRTSDSDARSRLVSLTARGQRLAREVEAASRGRFTDLLQGIPAEHRRAVLVGLTHLVAAMEQLPNATHERDT